MARIAIVTMQEHGHYAAAIAFAKAATRAGHTIVFVGLPDYMAVVRRAGLELRPVLADVAPEGTLAQQQAELARLRGKALEAARARIERHAWTCASRLAAVVPGAIGDLAVDLVIVSALLPFVGLACLRSGHRCALLHVGLPTRYDPRVPPVTSSFVPDRTKASQEKVHRLWRERFRAIFGEEGAPRVFRSAKAASAAFHTSLATAAGGGGEVAPEVTFGSFGFALRGLPEIVLSNRALDFPRGDGAAFHFTGTMIDRDRVEATFDWKSINPDRPLAYASLGSQAHRVPGARQLFENVVTAFAVESDLQLVVDVGSPPILARRRLPRHILLAERPPQLTILRRAQLMLTQGGLASVQESIAFGVPMLVFPTGRDQPGIAARVVHHRLGRKGTLADSATAIARQVRMLSRDDALRRRLHAWKRRFSEPDSVAAILEELLEGGGGHDSMTQGRNVASHRKSRVRR